MKITLLFQDQCEETLLRTPFRLPIIYQCVMRKHMKVLSRICNFLGQPVPVNSFIHTSQLVSLPSFSLFLYSKQCRVPLLYLHLRTSVERREIRLVVVNIFFLFFVCFSFLPRAPSKCLIFSSACSFATKNCKKYYYLP